ncbi:MAG: lysyl oxidase family protein [Thermoleophilia bacterium]
MRRPVAAALLAAACSAALGLALATTESGSAPSGPLPADALLPDLDAGPPANVQIASVRSGGRTRYRLSFQSAAINVGRGALVIEAARPDRSTVEMRADQLVSLPDGSTRRVTGVGRLRFVVDPTHRHWHLLRAMAYELRSLDGSRLVRPDRKTGFCLGDRFEADPAVDLPGEPTEMVYNVNCGYDAPELLAVVEGISVGWGDNYEPWRDGQYIDVTGVPAGRHLLVHRVNPDRGLREVKLTNNASSAVLQLAWPRGTSAAPTVRVLRVCGGAPVCPLPAG